MAAGAWYAEYHFRKFQNMQDPDEWLDPWQDIEKAVVAASDLGDKALVKIYISEADNKLIRIDGSDKMFLSINLIELLCVYGKNADYRLLYLGIVDKLLNVDTNVIRIEDILNLRISLAMLIGDKALIIDSHEKAVKEYERLGDEEHDNFFRSVAYYKKALLHYDEILKRQEAVASKKNAAKAKTAAQSQKDAPSQTDATKAKIVALKQKLSDTEKASIKRMHLFGYKIDVSDIIKQQDIYFAGLDFRECIILLCALLRFRTKDEIKRIVDEDAKSGSLSMFLSQSVLDHKGHVIDTLPGLINTSDDKIITKNMIRKESELERLDGDLVLRRQLQIISQTQFSISDIEPYLVNNAIVPDGRSSIMAKGFYYGLKGDMMLAMNILSSEMENVFRNLAAMCGDNVYGLKGDFSEEFETLTAIFKFDKLNECVDPDIIFLFDGMMNQLLGANIRNIVNHGMMSEAESNSGNVLYFFCACMKYIFQYSDPFNNVDDATLEKLKKNIREGRKVKIGADAISFGKADDGIDGR